MGKTLIIAEAGVNHNGKLDLAFKLCEEAKKAGADVVKFQTFKTENNITRNVEMAEYQKKNVGKRKSQFDMVKELELSYEDFKKVKTFCEKIGIEFLSTPPDEESLDFLVSLGLQAIKIGSGEINNIPYLRKVGQKKTNVILSTGMATLEEVKRAYNTIRQNGAKSTALLHCTTNYPCAINEVNLRAMVTLKEAFGTKVGYSDHTLGKDVAVAAVALGAEIIEKHFTLDKNMEGPDHAASADPKEFAGYVRALRDVETILGTSTKKPTKSEKQYIPLVRKSLVARRVIKKGEKFTKENLAIKRPGTGLHPRLYFKLLGKKAKRDLAADEMLSKRDL